MSDCLYDLTLAAHLLHTDCMVLFGVQKPKKKLMTPADMAKLAMAGPSTAVCEWLSQQYLPLCSLPILEQIQLVAEDHWYK